MRTVLRPGDPLRRVGRRLAALLSLLTLTVVAALLFGAAPAQAHAELIGTAPRDGATEKTRPSVVVLQFSEQVLELGATVRVTGPGGTVEAGRARVAGAAVVQPLPKDLPDGAYRVAFRVTSDDGHPIEGTFGFTMAAGDAVAPTTTTSGTTPAATPAATPSAAPVATGAGADGSGPGTGWAVAGGAVVLTGVAGILLALTRRRRSGPATAPSVPPTD